MAGKAGRPTGTAVKMKTRPGRELTANARLVAFRALRETAEGRTPEEALAVQGLLLSPRDQGLATALTYEVLRHQAYLEWLLKSRLSAGRAGPELALVLKLGLAQLLYFDRLGDHAAVSETVALAKTVVPGRQGLVNAVLRGLLRDRESGSPWPPMPPAGDDPALDLVRRYSYPAWLVRKIWERFGPDEAEALLAAGNRPTPPTLRINPRRGTREELRELLPFETRPTVLSPWGLTAAEFSGRPEGWPGFAEGRFAVQDEASQLVGLLAGPLPEGATVLDACAGLGGKALHLAALHPEARITARDKDPAKLEPLRREAVRLGLDTIRAEAGDLLSGPIPPETFDLVLVDAPCSGLGVIRRRPDLKWNKTPDDPARLAELQLRLLTAAAGAVRPGGRLLYSVCTFTREEGPEVAARFLAARPDFRPLPPGAWAAALQPLLDPEGYLTLLPHRHHTDGFFWALFTRRL